MNKSVVISFLVGSGAGGAVTYFLHAKTLSALSRVEAALAVLVGKKS